MTLYSKSNGVWVENQLRWHAELETFPGNVWFSMKHNQNIALCSISEHKRFISSCFEQQYLLNWADYITGWMAAILHSPNVCVHFVTLLRKCWFTYNQSLSSILQNHSKIQFHTNLYDDCFNNLSFMVMDFL